MYDIVVVGGGHAGIEAAAAAARMNQKTLLITGSVDQIGSMPCNPSVGGPAKGVVVREIDALGGLMPVAADATALQVKMLNTAKGPGVWSLREQSDKEAYKRYMIKALQEMENLDILEGLAASLEVEDGKVKGITMEDGTWIPARAVVLTTGTYMAACVLKGHTSAPEGPDRQRVISSLSESLQKAGLETFRLKTGTPPRVARDSVDFSKAQEQPGSEEFYSFSETSSPENMIAKEDEELCYMIHTTPKTHQIIRDHLQDSAMYSGLVKGVGPRYCPSIEDKLVRFADKERHQLFLEPETRDYDTIYIQGFSTSMPEEVQEEMVHSLPGLENAVITKYAYAIEYDALNPLQMKPSLESKVVENLFTAGQINGTSGYEEAAGQGLMAGANAALKLQGREPIVLGRDEAYIGVMIDDLSTKGTQEPYRLLTSRAEFRLLLRHDNAEARLLEKGYEAGLVSEERHEQYLQTQREQAFWKEVLKNTHISVGNEGVDRYLEKKGYEPLERGISLYELARRPHLQLRDLARVLDVPIGAKAARAIEIELKYAGYIDKAKREAARMQKLESRKLPEDLDYLHMDNIALEARQKLDAIRPRTLGQASRISGINPADIAVLSLHLDSRS